MAVRNIEAINRQAEQHNKEVEAAKAMRNGYIDSLIEKIEKSKQATADAIDTILYMMDNNLRAKADKLCEQAHLPFCCNSGGCIQWYKSKSYIQIGRKEGNYFIHIGWSDHGMCEGYDVYRGMPEYNYEAINKCFNGRTYKQLLEEAASGLQSKLDTFFDLLEQL